VLELLHGAGAGAGAGAGGGSGADGGAGLGGRLPVDPAEIICSCNAVTRGQLTEAIARECLVSVGEVGEETRAGTGCGSCHGELEALISSARNIGDPVAKPSPGTIAA
jgi:NAD(P)H-nitrite reductase large subunit